MDEQIPSGLKQFIGENKGVVFVAILPILVSLTLYFITFGSFKFSTSSDDWGNFSDFLMPSITISLGIGNLFLLYLLAKVANGLANRNLEKELVFEIYKSFIAKSDDYTVKFIESSQTDSKAAQLYLALLSHHVESARESFGIFLGEDASVAFDELVGELAKQVRQEYNSESKKIAGIVTCVNDVNTFLFHQVRNTPKYAIAKPDKSSS